MHTLMFVCMCVGDDKPTMPELYTKIIEKYAAQWKELGALLGLQHHHVDNIMENNKHNPNQSFDCCVAMFERWLMEVPSPTWCKLENAVKKLSHKTYQLLDTSNTISGI